MEHPKLRASEIETVERLRRALKAELQAYAGDRWAVVTLGLVVELAGDIMQMMPGDTERPPAICSGCDLQHHAGPCEERRA